MASTIPSQERVVDPFASYNSNVVNRITEIVTHNTEGMLTVNSMQVVQDSTSPNDTLIVKPGYAVKDDVLIKITAEHIVDINDDDQYVSSQTPVESGSFYIVLDYQYLKQRPAPQANIKILKPSERELIDGNSSYILLKVVVLDAVIPQSITGVYDYDPDTDPIIVSKNNERPYIKYYAGGEVRIPTFDQVRDQGRVAYESERNKFFFGYNDAWGELTAGGVSININTDSTAVSAGMLCYVDGTITDIEGNGYAQPALSTDLATSADLVVTAVGQAINGTGRGIVSGFGEGVLVETGVLVAVGDILYLSDVEAGKVTNVRPGEFYQQVGRALSSGSPSLPIDIIFSPKLMVASSSSGQLRSDEWAVAPPGDPIGGYWQDVDVSALDGTNAFDCAWWDDDTDREVMPSAVQILSGGDIIRVYFSVNTLTINYMIQSPASSGSGGGGGGGGGGTLYHNALVNLSFETAGHVGFAAGSASVVGGHGNADHLATYIEASDVTFETLNVNGDVGDGTAQVSFGDHTHTITDAHNYNDVPTGSILLFEADTAIVGYTLLDTIDDELVYITKGSAAGGETGGTPKSGSTWSQTAHAHGITSESNHYHTTVAVGLTIAQMPAHTHVYQTGQNNWLTPVGSAGLFGGGTLDDTSIKYLSEPTGSGSSHSHGNTGNAGNHSHGGTTQSGGAASSWRPTGRNMTRQQKI